MGKAFEEMLQTIEKKYPLYQDKEGYNIGNTRALAVGWREALLWYWKTAEHLSPSDYELLEKELSDETS